MSITIPEFTTSASITGNTLISDADNQLRVLMGDLKTYAQNTYGTVSDAIEVNLQPTIAIATDAASSATTSAASANTYANNASTSENNAASSASTATTKATAASNSASAAATSATNAATSATNANNSATAASNSASAAATSAANAASTLTQVELLFDTYDDRFLGAKAVEPTVDNDGNPLLIGAMYFNTVTHKARFYNGTTWEDPEASAQASATNASNSASAAATSAANASASEANALSYKNSASTSATNAATSATNAATSETNALAYKNAAATSATNASNSATNAAISEANALSYKNSASTSATNAATSETNALASKNAAATSATNAATSATNAAASETNALSYKNSASTSSSSASSSATAASTSATNAATSETNALAYKNAAATSATNASNSASAAATSATNAATSETNASNSAIAASTSATNALASKNAAATSEANAATSEANAATSEANALASKNLAYNWAAAPEDTVVSGGQYSAYHYMKKAQLYAMSGAHLVDYVGLDTNANNTLSVGQFGWNSTEGTADLALNGATLQLGQEELVMCRASTAITNGKPVMAVGTLGASGRILVQHFDGSATNVKRIIGVATQDIALGADGFITAFGKVRKIDTSMFSDGDILYAINNGFTNVAPTTSPKVALAFVINAGNNGTIMVRVNGVDENANAYSASKLATPRTINGVSFDGTANITITDSTKISNSEKGIANGVATLDASGLVPSSQLPSYVDDVLEYNNLVSFPATGETGKIYVAKDTNKTYRWSGSVYIQIYSGAVDSVAGKTGAVTLTASDVGLGNVTNESKATMFTNPTFTGTATGTFSGSLSGNATTATSAVSATSATTATSANALNSVGYQTLDAVAQAQCVVTGGGTITVSSTWSVLWSQRFIVISNGNGSHFSTNGYFDITCPTSGTITGVGGHADITATAAGIPMGAWDSLYYILPIGSGATPLTSNFRIASYTSSLVIPNNWIKICTYNGDGSYVEFVNGVSLRNNTSINTNLYDVLGSDVSGAVANATNAVTADNLTGLSQSNIVTAGADLNTITTAGFYRLQNGHVNGVSDYGQMLVMHAAYDTITQIVGAYNSGTLYTRSGNPSNVGGVGAWTAWKTQLDDTNYSSYTYTRAEMGTMAEFTTNLG